MVLALEFWTPPFRFSTNALANLLVFAVKLGVTPQFGLQRHLAFKGAPKALQGVLANHQPAGWWFANSQLAGWWFASHQPTGWLFANHQPWSPNPTLVAFRGPGHPKAICRSIHQKMKRWTLKLERQHHLF